MTDEQRLIKSFLQTLKFEIVGKHDTNNHAALKISCLKPGLERSITMELKDLHREMLPVMQSLFSKPQGAVNLPAYRDCILEKQS